MKAFDVNTRLIESYLELLKNLNPSNKLDLIAKLTQSIKADIRGENNDFEKSFGAWDNKEDAEELVNTIRSSRHYERQIEEL